MKKIEKKIAAIESKLVELRTQLSTTTDPEERGNIEEKIDFIQDDIDELENELNEVDPEDVYGIFGKQDTPSLDMRPHY